MGSLDSRSEGMSLWSDAPKAGLMGSRDSHSGSTRGADSILSGSEDGEVCVSLETAGNVLLRETVCAGLIGRTECIRHAESESIFSVAWISEEVG